MKKIFSLLLLLLCMSAATMAQKNVLSEEFSSRKLPSGWAQSNNSWSFNGVEALVFASGAAENAVDTLFTPMVDVTPLTNHPTVTIAYVLMEQGGIQDELTLLYRTSTTDSWTVLQALEAQSQMTEVSVALPDAVKDNVQLAIAAKYNMAKNFPRIDYLIVENRSEATEAPTGFSFSNLTANSVDLFWDASMSDMFEAYNLKVSSTQLVDMSATADVFDGALDVNAKAISGLKASTTYYAYVQTDCGDGDLSPWAELNFRTQCAAVTTPYAVDFEAGLPECLAIETTSKTSGVSTTYPYNSTKSMYFCDAAGKYTYLFLPELDDDVTKYQISFMAAASETGLTYGRHLTIGVAESQNSATVTEVKAIELPYGRKWEHITVSLSSYKGTGKYIVLKGGNADIINHIYVDDIKIDKASTCPMPMFVSAGKISATTAEIKWTEAGSASEWNLVVAQKPYADPYECEAELPGEYAGSVTTNPYTLTGLVPQTTYYVYVQSGCAVGEWTNVVSFTTGKEVKFPFVEKFDRFEPEFYVASMASKADLPDGWLGGDRGQNSKATSYYDKPNTSTSSSYLPYVTTAKDHTNSAYQPASLLLRGTSISAGSTTATGYASYVMMPKLPVATLNDKMVRMWIFTSNTLTLKVGTAKMQDKDIAQGSQFGGATPNITALNDIAITGSTEWQLVELPLTKWTADKGDFITIWIVPGTATPTIYVDDIEVVESPSCMGVKSLKAEVLDANNIQLTWEENLSATSWKVKVSTTELADPATDAADVLTTTVSAPTYKVTGLNPATTYYLYVTPACGDYWKMVSATTEKSVGGLSVPYYNDFSSYGAGSSSGNATWQPGDMKVGNLGGNTSASYIPFIWSTVWAVNTGLTLPAEIVKPSLRFYGYYATSNKNSYGPYAVLPELTNANVKDVTISFWGHTESTTTTYNRKIEIGVIDDPSSVTASAITHVATATLDNTKAPQQFFINMKNYTGSGKYIVFYLNDATKTGYFNMDNLEINLTSKPWQVSNVVVNSKTQTSATIGWTENGSATKWNVKVFDHSVADPDAETALKSYTATSKTQVISGLVHSTRYFVYVQSVVGAEKGKWSSVCTFFTDCEISSLPYKEDFNIYDHGSTALNTLSPCYTVDGTYSTSAPYNNNYVKNGQGTTSATTATGPGTTYYYVDHTYGNDPTTNTFYMTAAKDKKALLMLPEIDGDLSQCVMRFYGAYSSAFSATTSTGGGAVEICLYDEATSTYTHVTDCKLTKAKEWEEFLVYFPEGATGRVAFRIFNTPEWRASIGNTYSSGATFYMYIDDIEIMEIPRCQKIQEVSYSDVSANGAKISWTKAGDETAWDVKVSTTLLDDPSEATADGFDGQVTENKKVLTGLTDNTKYYVYVRSVNESKSCVGEWCTPISFTTYCLPVAFPYEENFEDYLKSQIYPCGIMSGKDGQSFAYVDSLSSTNAPSIDGVSKKYLLIKQVAKDNNNYFSLPLMDFEDITKVQLKFKACPQYTGISKWEVGVMFDAGDPSSFVKIKECSAEYVSGTRPWIDYYVNFEDYKGDDFGRMGKYITFHPLNRITDVAKGTESSAQFYIDNIVVEPLETCVAPTLLSKTNVAETTVDLAWLHDAEAGNYRVRIFDAVQDDPATGNAVVDSVVATKNGTFGPLVGNHVYYAYVRCECGNDGNSTWSPACMFRTDCPDVTPLPYFENFDMQTSGSIASCWSQILHNTTGSKVSTSQKKSGTQSLEVTYGSSGGQYPSYYYGRAVTPVFDVASLKDVLLYFDAYVASNTTVTLEAVSDATADAEAIPLITLNLQKGWQFVKLDLGELYISVQPYKQIRFSITNTSLYIDNFGVTTEKDMDFPVSALQGTAIGDTYLAYSFVENADTESWIAEYGPTGFELGTGTQKTLTSMTDTIRDLATMTTYDIYVRGNKSGSAWVGPLTLTTAPKATQLPYVDGFEDAASNAEWHIQNCTANGLVTYPNQWVIADGASCQGAGNALYIAYEGEYGYWSLGKSGLGSAANSSVWAYRVLNFPYDGTYDISMKVKCEGPLTESKYDKLDVELVPAGYTMNGSTLKRPDGTTASTTKTNATYNEFNVVSEMQHQTEWTWVNARIDVKNPGIYYLVLFWQNYSTAVAGKPAAVDSIMIEEYPCSEVTNMRYTALGAESATVAWDAGRCEDFEVVVSKYRMSPRPEDLDAEDKVMHQEIKGRQLQLTNLLPSTTYAVYVRTICPEGRTAWVEFDVTTQCAAEGVPYTETFTETPGCWSLGKATVGTHKYLTEDMENAGIGAEDWNYMQIPADGMVILPAFELPIQQMGIKIGAYNSSINHARLTIGVVDNTYAPESFEQVAIFATTKDFGTTTSSAGNPYVVEEFDKLLNTYKGTGKHLAIRSDISVYVKYVTVYALPSCVAPQQVEVTDVTAESATLNWLTGTENAWQIEINGTDTLDVATQPYVLTGLKQGMEYSVRVRAVCSATDESEWSMPVNFLTDCEMGVLPINEKFDGQKHQARAVASCWDNMRSDEPFVMSKKEYNLYKPTKSEYFAYAWTSNWLNALGDRNQLLSWDYAGGTAVSNRKYKWFISPKMEFEGNASFSFDLRYCNNKGEKLETVGAGRFLIVYSEDGGQTWTDVTEFDLSEEDGLYHMHSLDISKYAGKTLRVAFYHEGISGNAYVLIDNVRFNCSATYEYEDHACEGYDYENNGFNIAKEDLPVADGVTTKTYTRFATAEEGCDSLIVLTLNTIATQRDTTTVTICEGESYEWGGRTFTEATETPWPIRGENPETGCDVISYLTVKVRPQAEPIQINKTINANTQLPFCYNTENNLWVPEGFVGEWKDTLYTDSANCQKTQYYIHVLDVQATMLNENICEGDGYPFAGKTITESGIYYDTIQSSLGADSVVCLTLNVLKSSTSEREDSFCEGDTYDFNGHILSAAGEYKDTTYYETGCINVITTLTLTEKKKTYETLNVTICSGIEYTLFGQTYDKTGVYTVTGTNKQGCDSIVTLNLTVDKPIEKIVEAYFCEGGEYTDVNTGATYTTPGTYSDTLQTEAGCDSIYTLILTMHEVAETKLSETICEGETYEFNGEQLTQAGVYYATLEGQYCDSVVVLTLTVTPLDTVRMDTVLLNTELPLLYEGVVILDENTQPGIYADTIRIEDELSCGTILIYNAEVKLAEAINNVTVGKLVIRPNYIQQGESVTVDLGTADCGDAKIEVFDYTGKLINTTMPNSTGSVVIDAFHTSGVYMINVTGKNGQASVGRVVVR